MKSYMYILHVGKGLGEEGVELGNGEVSLRQPLSDESVDDFREKSTVHRGRRRREKEMAI